MPGIGIYELLIICAIAVIFAIAIIVLLVLLFRRGR